MTPRVPFWSIRYLQHKHELEAVGPEWPHAAADAFSSLGTVINKDAGP